MSNNISQPEESFILSAELSAPERALCWHCSYCLNTVILFSPSCVVLLAKPGHRDWASLVANATLNLHEGTGYHTFHGAGHSLSLHKLSGSIPRRLQMHSHDMCCSLGALKDPCAFSTINLDSLREDGFASALIQHGHISFISALCLVGKALLLDQFYGGCLADLHSFYRTVIPLTTPAS